MKKLQHNMRNTFRIAIIVPGSIVAGMLVVTLTFGLLFSFTRQIAFLVLLIALDVALVVAYVLIGIYEIRSLHRLYQEGLFRVSNDNISRLSRGDAHLEKYPDSNIVELMELNKTVDRLAERWKGAVLYSRDLDYSALDLEFVDKEKNLVTASSLKSRLSNLVFLSKAFTVALLELYYELGEEKLNEDEEKHLLAIANEAFSFIQGPLFAFDEAHHGLCCYLPNLDSLSIVKEKIMRYGEELSVSKRISKGLSFFPVRAALVAYPHSAVEDMISDLGYAKRQAAPVTFFLPDRKKGLANANELKENQNTVAFFNKVLLPIRRLKGENSQEEQIALKAVFDTIGNYIDADFRDVIVYERTTNHYYTLFGGLAGAEKLIDNELISQIVSICDEDNSFYFSSRASCSHVLARKMDELGIVSGFIYALFSGGECNGVLYFGSRSHPLYFDAYMKEALIRLGEAFTDYFLLAEKESRAQAFQSESEHILGLSNYMVYKVDAATMKLTYYSPNMRAYYRDIETGKPCYEALYGSDRVCAHCPLKTFERNAEEVEFKLQGKIRNVPIETSLMLNDRKSTERSLLIERKPSLERSDPYDRNWLVYSYQTLIGQLENAYLLNTRGYLLLISLDNMETFLQQQGSEGCCFAIRSFAQKLKSTFRTHDVYAYNASTLAMLLPRYGHVEIVDLCEKIYDISKTRFYDDGSDDRFILTYLPLGYPQGHASAADFLNHAEEFYRNGKYDRGKDFIYFRDHSIRRSASRKDHMLAVIDEVFGPRTASCVYLQPFLTAKDKKIYGAEILLRVEDTIRKNFFRADELSDIAEQNNRISLITESLLNFVGELYAEHGTSLFALNNFRRISINVDAAFLKDTELSKKVVDLYANMNLAKDFLAFEVPEDLIGDNFDANNAYVGTGAVLVCDRYTGRYVSMEKLKSYGFTEIKLPRELVNGIDSDPKKLADVASMINNAKALGLRVSVVGVENSEQFVALRDLDPTMFVQGYHFYKPLSRSELVMAIGSHGH